MLLLLFTVCYDLLLFQSHFKIKKSFPSFWWIHSNFMEYCILFWGHIFLLDMNWYGFFVLFIASVFKTKQFFFFSIIYQAAELL